MNMRAVMLGFLTVASTLAPVYGEPVGPATDDGVPPGIEPARWTRMVETMRTGGYAPDTVAACLVAARETAQRGLPPEPVVARIEEGVAKKAEGNAVLSAARQRVRSMGEAAALLKEGGYASGNEAGRRLVVSVALALESGLRSETLQGVLKDAGGKQTERVRCVIEAGETMRLDGMDEETVGQLMGDFMERNLRRMEIIRASRYAVQQHHARIEGTRIRQQLWSGGTGAGSGAGTGVRSGLDNPRSGGGDVVSGRSRAGSTGAGPAAETGNQDNGMNRRQGR